MQRWQTGLDTTKHGQRMAQNLPQPTRQQMPCVSGPYFFGMKPISQLTENSLDPIAHVRQISRPGMLLTTRLPVRGQQLDPMRLQIRCQFRSPIIAICQSPAGGPLQDFFGHFKVMDIGRRQADRADHSWPGHPHMGSQAEKGLSGHLIMSKSGPARDQFRTIRSGKPADRHWQAIHQRNRRVIIQTPQNNLPQLILDGPQIGSLPDKGRPVHPLQGRKPVSIISSKMQVQPFICIYTQEFTHDFDGQHFAISQCRSWSALPQRFSLQPIINQAEYSDQKCGSIHLEISLLTSECLVASLKVSGSLSFVKVL